MQTTKPLQGARCDALSGNDKDVCIKQAKAHQKPVLKQMPMSRMKPTKRLKDAREDKAAAAQYKVAKEKCDAMLINSEKDACQERAKATYGQ